MDGAVLLFLKIIERREREIFLDLWADSIKLKIL
jgi:hypothetical protein